MLTYILQRILYFIPTLLLVSLLAFALSRMMPGDPVERICSTSIVDETVSYIDPDQNTREYQRCAALLGYDKPAFYFSILPLGFPDTLSRFVLESQRKTLKRLMSAHGDWPAVMQYYARIKHARA